MPSKKFYIFAIILISTTLLLSGVFTNKKIANINKETQKASVIEVIYPQNNNKIIEVESKDTTLVFVGDMMLDRGVETSVKNNFGGEFSKLFENLNELKDADILFANLEGPVSDVGNNVGSIYSFHMDPNVLPVIKDAGFDIVSFANNHVGDWNTKAFNDTLARLDNIGILKIGAGINKIDASEPKIIEKNGVKFGFIGFSDVGPAWMEAKDDTAGILLASDPNLPQIIQYAKAKVDVLIVSFHFGEEYKTIHNTRQEKLAKNAIDNGADLIIGHHPHVIEDVEIYNGKPIVYSLGNFIFDQYFSKNTMRGMLYKVTFSGNEIVNTESKIITLNKQYQPEGIFLKEEMQTEKEEETQVKKETIVYVCPVPKIEYEDMWLLNIGQNVSLPDETYIPKNLVNVDKSISTQNNFCLTEDTNINLKAMLAKAKIDELNIKVSSAFRSYNTQQIIMNGAINAGNKYANLSIAKAGYSEHQLGTTVDLTGSSINFSSAAKAFDNTPEAIWLENNASDFGFVRSYPFGKEDITGYMYEPWHYRYVGIENAKLIKEKGLTINEFLK
ncbi:MAG: CapA family protein [Candidatus Paceibacterota bacterium]